MIDLRNLIHFQNVVSKINNLVDSEYKGSRVTKVIYTHKDISFILEHKEYEVRYTLLEEGGVFIHWDEFFIDYDKN